MPRWLAKSMLGITIVVIASAMAPCLITFINKLLDVAGKRPYARLDKSAQEIVHAVVRRTSDFVAACDLAFLSVLV